MKRLISVIVTIALAASMSACGMFKGTTQKYMEAFNKTQSADSMQAQTKYNISMDLSKAPEEVKEGLEKYKEVTVNTDQWIDNKNRKSETRSFVKAGEMMLDSKIYALDDKVYLKSFFTGDKYMDLTSGAKQNNASIDMKNQEKFYNDLLAVWKDAVQNEVLVTEGNSIENTPDGDIKVTILTLELNDEKSKNILKKITELYARNDEMIAMAAEGGAKIYKEYGFEGDGSQVVREYLKKLPETLEKNKDKFAIEKLKLTAKIDKDSHIIDETLEGTFAFKVKGEIRANFNMHTTRWNIDSGKVKVNIPEIKKEDIIETKDMNFNNSEMFKMFKDKFKK
ncbi:MAG: hypothetical protein N2484_04320 [Clostridia bacterium]|nr:hypothetical protein [Clostridia bacterium]